MDSSPSPVQCTTNRETNDLEEDFMTPESDRRGKRIQTHEDRDSQEPSKSKQVLPKKSYIRSHFKRIEENHDIHVQLLSQDLHMSTKIWNHQLAQSP